MCVCVLAHANTSQRHNIALNHRSIYALFCFNFYCINNRYLAVTQRGAHTHTHRTIHCGSPLLFFFFLFFFAFRWTEWVSEWLGGFCWRLVDGQYVTAIQMTRQEKKRNINDHSALRLSLTLSPRRCFSLFLHHHHHWFFFCFAIKLFICLFFLFFFFFVFSLVKLFLLVTKFRSIRIPTAYGRCWVLGARIIICTIIHDRIICHALRLDHAARVRHRRLILPKISRKNYY